MHYIKCILMHPLAIKGARVGISEFTHLISGVTKELSRRALDEQLEAHLNQVLPASGAPFQQIFDACRAAIAEGWMCQRSAGGIRYGRVLKPTPDLDQFSVDVVEMNEVVGPHHAHPKGEIDMVMPIDADAQFDGHKAGWCMPQIPRIGPRSPEGGRSSCTYYRTVPSTSRFPPPKGN
jgi:hypothetical protein